MKLDNIDLIYIDLDRTTFRSFLNRGNEECWAKDLKPIFSKTSELFTVHAENGYAVHNHQIKDLLIELRRLDIELHALTGGGLPNRKHKHQPTTLILKEMGIYNLFHYVHIGHEGLTKAEFIGESRNALLIDDSNRQIEAANDLGIETFKVLNFETWPDEFREIWMKP